MGIRLLLVRDLLDAVRQTDPAAYDRLSGKLEPRYNALLDRARETEDRSATLSIDLAEDLFLAIEAAIGDGSSRHFTALGVASARKILSERRALVADDLLGTVARMQAPFEAPFVDLPVRYELLDTDTGFTLRVGLIGRPRSTRFMRSLAEGFINAAYGYRRETGAEAADLRLLGETLGDHATLTAFYRRPTIAPPPVEEPKPTRRSRPSAPYRLGGGSLSQEVERILDRAKSTPPPPMPRERPTQRGLPAARKRALDPAKQTHRRLKHGNQALREDDADDDSGVQSA